MTGTSIRLLQKCNRRREVRIGEPTEAQIGNAITDLGTWFDGGVGGRRATSVTAVVAPAVASRCEIAKLLDDPGLADAVYKKLHSRVINERQKKRRSEAENQDGGGRQHSARVVQP